VETNSFDTEGKRKDILLNANTAFHYIRGDHGQQFYSVNESDLDLGFCDLIIVNFFIFLL